ncbi:MAG TPA: zinc-ribbon domain-containing protein [Pyrinomonadaceae bacterium]|nr:zinc-ribbon domain-containing protein [Pyrinomonadaceae bacterium]
MSTDFMSGETTVSDHDVTLAIPGDIASVRSRLVEALQQVGYKVIGDQPIYAKRGREAAARFDCSLNVLDYPTTLRIGLKQTNDVSVLATFNYEVKSYMRMTKGDHQTLAREAEAVAALATERLAISSCRSCGTQVTDESHFCRRCGAPLVFDVPELEVLRLTRGARGSFHNIVGGLMAMFVTVLTAGLAYAFTSQKVFGALLWVALAFGSYALFLLLQGVWQLHRTLNSKAVTTVATSTPARVSASVTTALPSAPARVSITEGTTELLVTKTEPRVAEPVRRKDLDTGEIESDRLM